MNGNNGPLLGGIPLDNQMNGLSLEEQNIMKAMAASAQHVDSAAEEERLLQMAL